jgi:hypothetical protein
MTRQEFPRPKRPGFSSPKWITRPSMGPSPLSASTGEAKLRVEHGGAVTGAAEVGGYEGGAPAADEARILDGEAEDATTGGALPFVGDDGEPEVCVESVGVGEVDAEGGGAPSADEGQVVGGEVEDATSEAPTASWHQCFPITMGARLAHKPGATAPGPKSEAPTKNYT